MLSAVQYINEGGWSLGRGNKFLSYPLQEVSFLHPPLFR